MIGLRGVHLVEQLLRQCLTCQVMLGKGVEELLLVDEVLVELRRQLYEVAWHVRARHRGVLTLGEHAVQAVSELMQEGAHLVVGKQCRLVVGGTGEVHHVDDMRT